MGQTVYCGIKVSGERERPCGIAFLGDELETFSETDDERILELLEERKPNIIAFSVPIQGAGPTPEGFTEQEQELVDEGHTFLPRGQTDTREMERALFLKNSIKRLGFMPEMLECRPRVTADELGIHTDDELEDHGIPSEDISSTWEFDAVLAALTAKLYDNELYEEKEFIIPRMDPPEDDADEMQEGRRPLMDLLKMTHDDADGSDDGADTTGEADNAGRAGEPGTGTEDTDRD